MVVKDVNFGHSPLMIKDILGYEGHYKVDMYGNVYSLKSNKILAERPHSNGYKTVGLYLNGRGKNFYIHRLVADAFISQSRDGLQVNHIDGNRANNRVDNLEWVTVSENIKDSHKRSSNKRKRTFEKIRKLGTLAAKLKPRTVKQIEASRRNISKYNDALKNFYTEDY